MIEEDARESEEVDVTPYEGDPDDVTRALEDGQQDDEVEGPVLETDSGEALGGLELPEVTD